MNEAGVWMRRRWKLLVFAAALVLGWWAYSAPANVAKRLRASAEAPGGSQRIAARVDFPRVNAQLSGDLQRAARNGLSGQSFAQLLLHGWLPQQRPAKAPLSTASVDHTRLYQVRYKSLNSAMAIFWDARQVHEVILTLERDSPFSRWRVTRVVQFNACAYEFDCATVPLAEIPARVTGANVSE
ncbi:hypothetical protein M9978_19120 [Sphingomonas sp. MG17]|uniref:DUF2939 domain-containing protein n=1 Tax=Sphingomonas tagetis TaxID=2949092 RepID=A0A9X2HNH9_9SPHN|nr:hypothetical protein [Sphingomonas tagetis]MCP3732539.1 hypothetical protein [Sphingomonas tagetis]